MLLSWTAGCLMKVDDLETPYYSLHICDLLTLLYAMGRPVTFTTEMKNVERRVRKKWRNRAEEEGEATAAAAKLISLLHF